MDKTLLLVATAALIGVSASAQLRITSFNSGGQLTFTNWSNFGSYRVEWAHSPAGPWRPFSGTATNLNSIMVGRTNSVTVNVSQPYPSACYRAIWTVPDPNGTWDYYGYDRQGNLVVTGQVTLAASRPISGRSADDGYAIHGSWNLQYAGPPTNAYWWLGPQIGAGYLYGNFDVGDAHLVVWWPTNCVDCNIQLFGFVRLDTCTGQWDYYGGGGPIGYGPFTMQRRTPAKSEKTRPGSATNF